MPKGIRILSAVILIGLVLLGFPPDFCSAGKTERRVVVPTGFYFPAAEYVEPFQVQLIFDALPKLGEASVVHLRIEALGPMSTEPIIGVMRSDPSISCDPFAQPRWMPPIEEGDVYEGSFKITATKSGEFVTGIGIRTGEEPYPPSSLYRVFFGFTESGNLAYLSDEPGSASEDSLARLKSESRGIGLEFEGNHFSCRLLVGIPEFAETTSVYFKITAKDDYAQGVDVKIHGSEALDILDQREAFSVTAGGVFRCKGSFKILPLAVGESRFTIRAQESSSPGRTEKRSGSFGVALVFDEKGKIREIAKADEP